MSTLTPPPPHTHTHTHTHAWLDLCLTKTPRVTHVHVNTCCHRYRLPQPEDCPDDMQAIMMGTWAYDKSRRPTMSSVCETLGAIKKRYPYEKEQV
jgi:hypothetical protein